MLSASAMLSSRSIGSCWLLILATAACDVGEVDDPDDLLDPTVEEADPLALTAGVNGAACTGSPYNCKFRATGGNRVMTAGGEESWGIEPGGQVRDGDGGALATQTGTRLIFNYGQTRFLAGEAHALALSTSNGSAGWYPIGRIKGEASFRARMGEVNARDPGRGRMACYQIRDGHDPAIELRKVVYDSRDSHERVGDYLPLPRRNGRRSANLVFSVPGFGLGGATTDHFPAGTRFQRVEVPTSTGRPSISIPTYVAGADGRYTVRRGSVRFLYGYVRAADGVRRFGWMAEDALRPSSGCD